MKENIEFKTAGPKKKSVKKEIRVSACTVLAQKRKQLASEGNGTGI